MTNVKCSKLVHVVSLCPVFKWLVSLSFHSVTYYEFVQLVNSWLSWSQKIMYKLTSSLLPQKQFGQIKLQNKKFCQVGDLSDQEQVSDILLFGRRGLQIRQECEWGGTCSQKGMNVGCGILQPDITSQSYIESLEVFFIY